MDNAQDTDLAPYFGDFSQSEKLSEIKPPLGDSKVFFLCENMSGT